MFRQYKAQLKISGVFKGFGEGRYITPANPVGVIGEGMMILDEPMSFDVLAVSCTSVQSVVFSLAAPGIYGAKSLIDILGPGNLEASAIYRIFNERFKLIGEVEQRLNALIKENNEGYITTGETIVEGSCESEECKGTIVKYSPGYAVYLRQVDEETIEGVYGQVIYTTVGKLYTLTRRIYHKKDMRSQMPFDEILIYYILDLERNNVNGKHVIKWHTSTYYTPAKG
jgi:hypothetical protein